MDIFLTINFFGFLLNHVIHWLFLWFVFCTSQHTMRLKQVYTKYASVSEEPSSQAPAGIKPCSCVSKTVFAEKDSLPLSLLPLSSPRWPTAPTSTSPGKAWRKCCCERASWPRRKPKGRRCSPRRKVRASDSGIGKWTRTNAPGKTVLHFSVIPIA